MTDTLDIEEINQEIGIGKFQVTVFLNLICAILMKAMYNTNYVFCAGEIPYRCKVPQCEKDPPQFDSSPWDSFALPPQIRNCYRYTTDNDATTCEESSFTTNTEKCYSWVYKDTDTIVYDFDLACQEWKRTTVGTVHSFAYFCALPFVAYFSDTFGRRKALIVSAVGPSVMGFSRAFVNNYYWYLVLEFLESFIGCATFSTAFILGLEMINVKRRVVGGNMLSCTFATGQSCLALFAFLCPNWRHLTMVIYAPSVLFLIYIWTVDESIRWLVAKGKRKAAVNIILKAARMNRKVLSLKTMSELEKYLHNSPEEKKGNNEENNSPPSTKDLVAKVLKSRSILLRWLVCSFWWMTMTTVYYGLSINSVSLSGNRYVNFFVMSLVEIPGYLMSVLTLDRFGRKSSIMTAFFFCAVLLGTSGFIKNLAVVRILTMFGKVAISMIFCSIYIYTVELFPTQVRHILMGACSMMGRVGSMMAPQTPLLREIMTQLPNILFGTMAGIAGLLMLLTPETLKLKLPDTISEAEEMSIRPRTRAPTDMLPPK